jgi:hypothetical protein
MHTSVNHKYRQYFIRLSCVRAKARHALATSRSLVQVIRTRITIVKSYIPTCLVLKHQNAVSISNRRIGMHFTKIVIDAWLPSRRTTIHSQHVKLMHCHLLKPFLAPSIPTATCHFQEWMHISHVLNAPVLGACCIFGRKTCHSPEITFDPECTVRSIKLSPTPFHYKSKLPETTVVYLSA